MRWYADTLSGVVSHAAEVDAAAVRALRVSHGADPHNAGHSTYTSLDQEMLPRALKLPGLGEEANTKQRKELQRLWQSLGPEARAQLWTKHRDDLLAAGLLRPQVKQVAADDGAGRYDVESPGISDYWKEIQANGISNSGDSMGKTDAARHMDHYLKGTGRTLDLDVDRMLADDPALRDQVARIRATEQDEWRRQALEAFEKSGGKPVAIPVESGSSGYEHERAGLSAARCDIGELLEKPVDEQAAEAVPPLPEGPVAGVSLVEEGEDLGLRHAEGRTAGGDDDPGLVALVGGGDGEGVEGLGAVVALDPAPQYGRHAFARRAFGESTPRISPSHSRSSWTALTSRVPRVGRTWPT